MNIGFDFIHDEHYAGNAVIERGHRIYEEWCKKRLSSRKIVKRIERTISAAGEKKTPSSYAEALSCFFALDMRIKEKYRSAVKCFLRYFSWHRELTALKKLQGIFNISDDKDIHDAIEIGLENIREKLSEKAEEGTDDETHGGKANGIEEEADMSAENSRDDLTAENANEESAEIDAEERESEELSAEELSSENDASEKTEAEPENDISEELRESYASDVRLEETQPQHGNNEYEKEENVASEDAPKLDLNKTEKNDEYRKDEADEPLLFEQPAENKRDDRLSFIDEVIIDNMVKGKTDFVSHNPLEDVKKEKIEIDIREDVVKQNNDSSEKDKNMELYDDDKLTLSNGNSQDVDKNVGNKEIKSEDKTEIKAEPEDNYAEAINPDKDADRVPIQVELTLDHENEMRRAINDSLNMEQIIAIKEGQEAALREQFSVLDAEMEQMAEKSSEPVHQANINSPELKKEAALGPLSDK